MNAVKKKGVAVLINVEKPIVSCLKGRLIKK